MSTSANLTVLKDGVIVKTCPIEGELVLGRSKDSGIRLDDKSISRQHAVFKWLGGNLQVENKSEFGALLVNGAECTSIRLNNSDVISVGPFLIQVSIETGKNIATAPTQSLGGAEKLVLKNSETGSPEPLQLADGQNSSPDSVGSLLDGELLEASPPESGTDGLPDSALESLNMEDLKSEELNPEFGAEAELVVAGEGNSSQDFASVPEPSDMIADDGKTKFTPASTLSVRLIFEKGTANVTEYNVTQDETSIGRGKDCDIVLNDKKSSRKNSVIRKAGSNFLIKDLESANGTFVNGVKVKEHELSGDDFIKIGGVQFQFKAESADYVKNQKNFMEVDNASASDGFDLSIPESGMEAQSDLIPEQVEQQEAPSARSFTSPNVMLEGQDIAGLQNSGIPGIQGPSAGQSGVAGITGLGGGSTQKRTLLERFRTLPKRTQIIGTIAMILFFMFLAEDDTPSKKKKGTGKKAAVSGKAGDKKIATGPASFDSLSAEQKRFVEAQHGLAFDYYKNKEYDKALFEIAKIFALIPDYKDAREIERYAKEGKRKLEALEEERKKKEDEAQLKDKIAHLVDDARRRMDFEQVNELFTRILELDPDNATVAEWRKEIEAHKEEMKQKLQQKEVIAAVIQNAWSIYKQGLALKKSGKYHSAIATFLRVIELDASQKKISILAKSEIRQCHSLIKAARDPVLAEAKQSEDAGDFTKAFQLYKKATQIDPPHPMGHAGMNRIKGILHDRAKAVYTEAIIAESYSDFKNAKRMFKECLDNSPVDDIYHERAARKLAHYFEKKEDTQ
jgi:pSer/pThr/pTyr-binding forkhead associated (FHA) protein/tetratricopeptide (TPR) repeat protein